MTAEAQEDSPREDPAENAADELVPRWRRRTEQAVLAAVAFISLAVIAGYAFFDSQETIDLAAQPRGAAVAPGWRPVDGAANEPFVKRPEVVPYAAIRSRTDSVATQSSGEIRPEPKDEPTANGRTSAERSKPDARPTPDALAQIDDRPKTKATPARFQLDVNAAERAEWMQLPGIGEILASRILASREAHGPFTRHDDLLRVSGIGPKTLAKLKPFLLPLPEPPPSAPARE